MEKKEIEIESKHLGKKCITDLYLVEPGGALLVLLHGLNGNREDWTRRTNVLSWAQSSRINLVLPDADNSFYLNRHREFFNQELFPRLRQMGFSSFLIAGLSMGGYGAMILGLDNPDMFTHIVALSSAMPVQKHERMWRSGKIDETRLKIFGPFMDIRGSDKDPVFLVEKNMNNPLLTLACGVEDDHIQDTRDFIRDLEKTGIEFTYIENRGGHNWDYWSLMLERIVFKNILG